ncbi:type II toxin-antitoxin system RelE/ParE family toxin [Bradyrhizobium sp. STM 3809]|uniref:type II toxin-antitoxin system RelE/ParE family toxin n=1 Tax=Bradyrhizobium sp. STM 3809 TaxID=551936 RepID=UPI00024098B0|nr:type II toxin-antitoxin system RelE/ParE family toxin [Bradyrhizobium sp. STM 3809]CCE01898.1 hypothetical protein BRAS3809_550011 [Bradyrhizobium sp. STM 3809]
MCWRSGSLSQQTTRQQRTLLHRFDRALQTLATNPFAGRERSDLGRGLRRFPVGSYVLFYIPATDAIEVVRILHAARDVTPDYLE